MSEQAAELEWNHATISPCGRYRYTLERRWARFPRFVLFLMLNPSTADGKKDDQTIRRCRGYARDWGYTGILVGNLYGWRATKPRDLWAAAADGIDVVGPENLDHVGELVARAGLIVCAWGQVGPFTSAMSQTMQLLRPPIRPHFLTMNAAGKRAGQPGHPLCLAKDLKPTPWDFFTDPRGNGYGA